MITGEYTFPPSGGDIVFKENGTILGVKAEDNMYIVMDVTNLSEVCVSILWKFWDGGEKEAESIKMGLLPKLKTRLALPVSAVRGKELFLKRTPGKLKTVVQGRPVEPEKITQFSVGADRSPVPTKIMLHALFVTDKKPDFPLAGEPLVDELGQKINGEWPGKTQSAEDMVSYLKTELAKEPPAAPKGCGKFGGSLKKRFEPTGFFALHCENGVYWLADPEGCAFFSSGADCVGVDGECNINGIEPLCGKLTDDGVCGREGDFYSWTKANLVRAFGSNWYSAWCKITQRRLREWGMNTIACWSDPRFIAYAETPYVHILHGFPRAEKYIFRDFPDVFDPEYAEDSRRWAMQLRDKRNDPYMIGYFMCNEPNWAFVDNLNIAEMTLESSERLHSREKLIDLLKEKYTSISALNSAWQTDFSSFEEIGKSGLCLNSTAETDTMELSSVLIREFVRVPALALREIDHNHLNLGMRYAWLSSPALAAGCEYFDVFSFNCYRHDPWDSIERMVEMVKMPVMIGEFHFGATDRGLDATGIQSVATQEDRARAYRRYMHRCAAHPYCLGAHYFNYNDQPYLGRFDGENYQIGLIDVCNRPYAEFADGVTRANEEVYDVRMGLIPVTDDIPDEREAIFY